MDSLTKLIASVLGIPSEEVNDELSFESIPEWDSLNHVNLMLALEADYGTEIDEDTMVELSSVAAIRAFVSQSTASP